MRKTAYHNLIISSLVNMCIVYCICMYIIFILYTWWVFADTMEAQQRRLKLHCRLFYCTIPGKKANFIAHLATRLWFTVFLSNIGLCRRKETIRKPYRSILIGKVDWGFGFQIHVLPLHSHGVAASLENANHGEDTVDFCDLSLSLQRPQSMPLC